MKTLASLSALALVLATGVPTPSTAADVKPARTCFWSRDVEGHSFGSANTIYLRVRPKDVYALESSSNCTAAHMRGDPLIFKFAGSSGQICSPLDIDLKIGYSSGGPATPCIIKSIKKLTAAEASAIPKKLQP